MTDGSGTYRNGTTGTQTSTKFNVEQPRPSVQERPFGSELLLLNRYFLSAKRLQYVLKKKNPLNFHVRVPGAELSSPVVPIKVLAGPQEMMTATGSLLFFFFPFSLMSLLQNLWQQALEVSGPMKERGKGVQMFALPLCLFVQTKRPKCLQKTHRKRSLTRCWWWHGQAWPTIGLQCECPCSMLNAPEPGEKVLQLLCQAFGNALEHVNRSQRPSYCPRQAAQGLSRSRTNRILVDAHIS